jgi:hypothetical protein
MTDTMAAKDTRLVVKGQRNRKGGPLRTDFGLGGADIVTLPQARDRALEYRRMAKQGLNPRFNAKREIPTFGEISQQVHIERLPTELLSSLVFEALGSCSDLVVLFGFDSVFKFGACDDFGQIVKAA